MKQKQLNVGLSDMTRSRLEAAAAEAGHSVAEEVRQRLEKSLHEDTVRVDVLRLESEVREIVRLVEMQCGHRWNEHPATAQVLRLAIDARLARYGARKGLAFSPGELPDVRLVAADSDEPDVMAVALEAIVHNKTDHGERYRAMAHHGRKLHENLRRNAMIRALDAELANTEPQKKERAFTRGMKRALETERTALEAQRADLQADLSRHLKVKGGNDDDPQETP